MPRCSMAYRLSRAWNSERVLGSPLCGAAKATTPSGVEDGKIVTQTNNCGGILGGITDGMPLIFRAAFKPTPSLAQAQKSVRLSTLEECTLEVRGRHDPCIVPRAVPVVESAAAIVLMDMLLADGFFRD